TYRRPPAVSRSVSDVTPPRSRRTQRLRGSCQDASAARKAATPSRNMARLLQQKGGAHISGRAGGSRPSGHALRAGGESPIDILVGALAHGPAPKAKRSRGMRAAVDGSYFVCARLARVAWALFKRGTRSGSGSTHPGDSAEYGRNLHVALLPARLAAVP